MDDAKEKKIIAEIEVMRLTIKPGEFLIVRLNGIYDSDEINKAKQIVNATLPGVPVLVVGDDVDFFVGEKKEA